MAESKRLTVADVFAFHELGLGHNPKRSSIVWVVENQTEDVLGLATRVMDLVLDGKLDGKKALGLIGEKVVALSKARIKSNIPPRLKEATIRRKTRGGKRKTTALIDTGQLINSLRWNITKTTGNG